MTQASLYTKKLARNQGSALAPSSNSEQGFLVHVHLQGPLFHLSRQPTSNLHRQPVASHPGRWSGIGLSTRQSALRVKKVQQGSVNFFRWNKHTLQHFKFLYDSVNRVVEGVFHLAKLTIDGGFLSRSSNIKLHVNNPSALLSSQSQKKTFVVTPGKKLYSPLELFKKGGGELP